MVVGPQKTGTSALHRFLSLHPGVRRNFDSPQTFEEVQFFSGSNYLQGLDWYLDFFPLLARDRSSVLLFEKSANYFDATPAPARVAALLPRARIVVIVIDPSLRAYSWYQV